MLNKTNNLKVKFIDHSLANSACAGKMIAQWCDDAIKQR